jgi:hypothetical protein
MGSARYDRVGHHRRGVAAVDHAKARWPANPGSCGQRDIGPSPAYNVLQGTNYVIDLSVSAGESHDFPYSFKSRHIGDQFFFGFVEYNDIFGRRHTSRFCMRLFPAQKPRESGKMQLAGADSWRAFD